MFIDNSPGLSSISDYIKEIIAEEAIDTDISLLLIETSEDAKRLHFTGSPTVRINGIDIEPNMKTIKGYGLRSFHYLGENQITLLKV